MMKRDEDFPTSDLQMDQAFLSVQISNSSRDYRMYFRHIDCIKCPFQQVPMENDVISDGFSMVLTEVPRIRFRITSQLKKHMLFTTDPYICEFGKEFGEFGYYQLHLDDFGKCVIEVIQDPVSLLFPIIYVVLIYTIGCMAFYWAMHFFNFSSSKHCGLGHGKRIVSLDVFRGIATAIMVFVNGGAGGFPFLSHATWDGIHLADLISPWFIWIMTFHIPIYLHSNMVLKKVSKRSILTLIFKRSVKLFALGLFVSSTTSLECLRVFGVLQRLALIYFVVSWILVYGLFSELSSISLLNGSHNDIKMLWSGWLLATLLLGFHSIIFFLMAADTCPVGYAGPGGLHDDMKYVGCTGGVTAYVDKLILGKHIFRDSSSNNVFRGDTVEPEGLFGCLACIFHGFFGVQAGIIYLTYQKPRDRLIRWLCWGYFTGILGICLTYIIPPNRTLWTISFVFITSSSSFFLYAILYFIIDLRKFWSGKPFNYLGVNALMVYLGHELFDDNFPLKWTLNCDGGHRTHFIALLENIWSCVLWTFIAYKTCIARMYVTV